MTSKERVKKAINHKKTDFIPVGPYMGNYGAKIAGVKLNEYHTNGKKMADAQYRAWEILGQDIVVPQSDGYYISEGFGTKTELVENSTPIVKKYALDDIKQVTKLRSPNPYKDGRMYVYIEAVGLLKQRLGETVCIRSTGTGPFSLASHLIGIQPFLTLLMDIEFGELDISYYDELMQLTTKALTDFTKACLKEGADTVQCGDSLASLDIISPEFYEKYVYPYEKIFFDSIRELKEAKDAAAILHICGDNTKIVKKLANTGCDILELDYKVDLSFCKKKVGDKVCLMGNLNPAGALLYGSPQDVGKEGKECIAMAAKDGGFILGSGCEVAVGTPIDNIKALIDVARK